MAARAATAAVLRTGTTTTATATPAVAAVQALRDTRFRIVRRPATDVLGHGHLLYLVADERFNATELAHLLLVNERDRGAFS